MFYNIGMCILNGALDLGFSTVYNTCLHGKDEDMSKNYGAAKLVVLPSFLLVLASAALDLIVYLKMKNLILPSPDSIGQQNAIDKVVAKAPLRSTIMNTFFLIPYVTISVVINQFEGETSKEKLQLAMLPLTIVNMGRVWMLITCTFKVNELNRRRDEDEERERKRELEIKAALEKRRHRALKRQGWF